MQVWNQVKVMAPGAFEGRAGVVIRVDNAAAMATVQLDETVEPAAPKTIEVFAFTELVILG